MKAPGLLACLLLATGLASWLAGISGGWVMQVQQGPARLVLLFVMWSTMMAAMMLPASIPAIRTQAMMQARLGGGQGAALRTLVFTSAYLLPWVLFSLAATAAQPWLDARGATDPMLRLVNPLAAASLLVLAGLWQALPAKTRCLTHCRTPFERFARGWRQGLAGALRMGLSHGLSCLGCCWALMLVLFAGGAMDLLVVVALASYVAAERLLPFGAALPRLTALILIGGGLACGAQALALA